MSYYTSGVALHEAQQNAAAAAAAQDTKVYLFCVKEGGKLRVRIVSPGYLNRANCQFPRDLRVQGRYFRVDPTSIKLMTARNTTYYCIKNKNEIEIVEERDVPKPPPPKLKVFENEEQEECLICYDAPKESVFNPCGHYYTCYNCSKRCQTCPVCRVTVISVIDKKDME
jgi:hypothetical protein